METSASFEARYEPLSYPTEENPGRLCQKMHEENYNFKPTDVVRSYGQIIGHIAESQYFFCSIALGEKNPAPGIEKTNTPETYGRGGNGRS